MVPRSSSGFFHAQKYPEQPNAPDDFFYWLPLTREGWVRGYFSYFECENTKKK